MAIPLTDEQKKDWKERGFVPDLMRKQDNPNPTTQYISGISFDANLDEMIFNRMLQLKDLRVKPQGNQAGKIYWDGANKKYKLWVDNNVGWVDVQWSSTSTTSSSSSSSSTSTTHT